MLRIYISLGCRITSHEYSFTCNQFKHTLYDQLLRFSLAIISRMCSPFFSVVRFLVPTITIFSFCGICLIINASKPQNNYLTDERSKKKNWIICDNVEWDFVLQRLIHFYCNEWSGNTQKRVYCIRNFNVSTPFSLVQLDKAGLLFWP